MPALNQYKTGLKREIISALTPLFGNTFPVTELRNKVYVGLEYPMKETSFPAIYVTYSEGPIENVGVGFYGLDGTTRYRQFKFTGTVNFNILALSQSERDLVGSALVDILTLGRDMPEFSSFHDEISDNDYILIHLMTDQVVPGGETVNTSTPWQGQDEIIYGASYRVNLFGEFYSDTTTGDLITIGEVDLYPYLTGDPAPW